MLVFSFLKRNLFTPVTGLLLFAFLASIGLPAIGSAQEPIISEFMARNQSVLQDEDGEFEDWLEIHNPSANPVDMEGWFLTDDPLVLNKWKFPAVTIPASGFLTVFCSAKDRIDPEQPLHTNFKLRRAGEYLALVFPDGATVSWQFSPRYREQLTDVSFGFPQELSETVFLDAEATATALVPENGDLGMSWTEPDFDDAAWVSGPTGVGFDLKGRPTYTEFIGTDIGEAMRRVNATAFIRVEFEVTDPAEFDLILLRMQFEDGFIAYLNGEEVASANKPTSPTWNSRSSGRQSTTQGRTPQDFDITSHKGLLKLGTNLLAFHGMNDSPSSSDFFILPKLVGVKVGQLRSFEQRYFDKPSPSFPNGEGFPSFSKKPEFSLEGGAYIGNTSVELTTDVPDSVIRFTTNGDIPDADSDIATGPISITRTTVLKARTFTNGLLPSPTVEQSYVVLNSNTNNWSSNLPVVIINTFGGGIGGGGHTPAHMMVVTPDPDSGRTKLAGDVDFAGNIGIKTRGSSTGGRPKASYSFEVWDEEREDRDVSILGLPSESDWILYGPYNFDPALIRNAFIYELSNQVGAYAMRTRFVEVFRNQTNNPVSSNDYFGVYVFMEKIKRGPDRVDVESLPLNATEEPEISGGYMLKIDRPDPGDSGFGVPGQTLRWVYPKEVDVRNRPAATWIRNWFNQFLGALNGPNFRDPEEGYRKYFNVEESIDHHLLNVLAMNVDALRLSTYMYKPRGGKLAFGPIWDFDRSMQSTDGRDDNPRAWNGTGDGTPFFTYPWWSRLFQDPDFETQYQARWRELRKTVFSTENMFNVIDSMADELREAQVRNFQRWSIGRRGGWEGELNLMKNWLSARATWIDSQFIPRPVFSVRGGEKDEPIQLELSSDSQDGELVYTLDGSDPRGTGGNNGETALVYSGPISISENTIVRARVKISRTTWSEIVEESYIFYIPNLIVTEIHYNPEGGINFEFIEIYNADDRAVNLNGAKFARGVTHTVEGLEESLQPGEYGVFVRDLDEFSTRYNVGNMKILGDYNGSLSDRSEEIAFLGPVGEEIFRLRYRDEWYQEETDGGGHSLVLRDLNSDPATWSTAEAWRPSEEIHGSPGKSDEPEVPGGQIAGDINQDGKMNITDVIGYVRYLFVGDGLTLPCGGGGSAEASNLLLLSTNGDFLIDASDAVYNLTYLFLEGPAPTQGIACLAIAECPEVCQAAP